MSRLSYAEQILDDGSRICGKGGTIRFFKDRKVAVQISGPFFDAQAKKLISRFRCNPKLPVLFDHLRNPCTPIPGHLTTQLLGELIKIREKHEFERALDEVVSSIRAARELSIKIVPQTTERFIEAIRQLARQHQRPPTKRELADALCAECSVVSALCAETGFAWLPKASAGRPSRTRRRPGNC